MRLPFTVKWLWFTSWRACAPRLGEGQAEYHVVQPRLEQLEKRVAGNAGVVSRHFEVLSELLFEHAVGEARLLLFAELERPVGGAPAPRVCCLPAAFCGALPRIAACSSARLSGRASPRCGGTVGILRQCILPCLFRSPSKGCLLMFFNSRREGRSPNSWLSVSMFIVFLARAQVEIYQRARDCWQRPLLSLPLSC